MARMKNKKLKLTRRVHVGVVAFEDYGIQRGDIATVAMTGDVRVGELGLFETGDYRGGAPGVPRTLYTWRWLAILCEQDESCFSDVAKDGGICLRGGSWGCRGEHGGNEYESDRERDGFNKEHGNVLVQTYGRVIAVERNGEPVKTTLHIRELDEREQATTAFRVDSYPKRDKTKPAPKTEPRLAFVDKRTAPLTSEQHEEIARLIKSSMDSTAKNPKPELTYEGRIVVRREVTTLARVVDVRRLQSHNVTFRRALGKFEQKLEAGKLTVAEQRRGRLAIEHLWRWLHGYVKPIEPRYFHGTKTPNPAARHGEGFTQAVETPGGLLMFTVPYDVDQYHEGDMVMVKQGAEIPNGALGVVMVRGEMMIGPIFQTDPYHIRVGFDYEDIYKTSQVKIIGPVVSGDYKPTSADEWPDVIGGTD
jgi:hypothetical protein